MAATFLTSGGSRASLGLQALGSKVLLIIGSSTAAGGGYESPDKPLYGGSGVGGSNSSGAGWLSDDLVAAGWTVVNVAVGSTDTAYWLAALPGHLATYRPGVVIVGCSSAATGDNVVASEANYNTYLARHTEMFRLIRQTGAVPMCQPQLPNDNSYTNVMVERMRRFQRWLEATGVLSWDALSVLGAEAMNGQFFTVVANCGTTTGLFNFTTTSMQPKAGMFVSGTGIAANTRVATFTPGSGGTFTVAVTTGSAGSLTFSTTIDGTHPSSKALAHRAVYKALPLDLIKQNGGLPPVLPDYHGPDRHGIKYTGTDTSAPITIPLSALDSFSVTFDLKNSDNFLTVNPLIFVGPTGNARMRFANGSVSFRIEARTSEIQSTLADLDCTDGVWHRWTITYHAMSSKWRLYRDGLQITTAAAGSTALEADGSIVYVPDSPVTGVIIGNGNGSSFYLRGDHALRNIVIHAVPLTTGGVMSLASGMMQADSLYAWFPCDDAVLNSSGQLSLAGQLRNVAGTLLTATLSATGAFVPITTPARRKSAYTFQYASNDAGVAVVAGVSTFTPPPGWVSCTVDLIQGGAGGGSGRRGAAGSIRLGGAGGAGGNRTLKTLFASATPAGAWTITVGAAGAGGVAPTTDDANGNNGAAGGGTKVEQASTLLAAAGIGQSGGSVSSSGFGGGGTAATSISGPSGASNGTATFASSQAGSANSTATSGSSNATPNAGVSGPGGGGLDAADIVRAPGTGFGGPQTGGVASATVGGGAPTGTGTGYGTGGAGAGGGTNGTTGAAGGSGTPGVVSLIFTFDSNP